MSVPLAVRQRDFAAWVTAREAPVSPAGVVGDARADAETRLRVYRHAYLARIVAVLGDDYPALREALGPARFDSIAAEYVHACPSPHFSLRYAGARLPAFLAEHEAARTLRASAPWAPDLARLELAVTDAFDAAAARLLTRAELAARPPERWETLSLSLVPGAQLLALAWPVRALRAAHDAGGPLAPPPLAPQAEGVLVWRRGERVLHRSCEAEEHALLARIAEGALFGELCASSAARRGDRAGAAHAALLLATWVDAELLASA